MVQECCVKFCLNKDLGDLQAFKEYKVSDLVEYIETLLARNEELESEVKHLEDELKDLEQNLEENYRPIPVREQVE